MCNVVEGELVGMLHREWGSRISQVGETIYLHMQKPS